MNYEQAKQLMLKRISIRRKGWPAGKFAFFDSDKDGKPDDPLPMDYPDPKLALESNREFYEFFEKNIVVKGGSKTDVNNRPWITQADSLEEDWEEYESAKN